MAGWENTCGESKLYDEVDTNYEVKKGGYQMKLGSEEWLKKLDENYAFPCKVSFNLIKENDDNVSIVSTVIKSKSRIENVKYSHARTATWTSQGSAVLSVRELESAMDYLKEVERLRNIWGYALKSSN